MAFNKERMQDLFDDSIVATPMPQASSTVDKRSKYKSFIDIQQHQITEDDSTMKQGLAAIEEMKKKLNIINYNVSSDSIRNYSDVAIPTVSSNSILYLQNQLFKLPGDSGIELNDQSLAKKDMLTEESGFTKLHNISDLERDELHCRESWDLSHIPSVKINMSLTAIENSKILPPDFMPADDSLFSELQSYNNKDETKIIMKIDDSARDTSHISHDDLTKLSKEIPSIADIALALKGCKEDANPRKIMDQVLKAGEKKTYANDKSSSVIKKEIEAIEHDNCCSGSSNVTVKNLITFEDCLIWGNVEIGHCKKRILHIIHSQEEQDIYTFSVEGSNAFKILVNCPKELSLSRNAISTVKQSSIYELHVLFQPNIIGQSTGFIKIESKSNKSFKKVCLNGFGGKARLLLHGLTFDPYPNKQCLTLSPGLKTAFTLENCGSATSFFYCSIGVLEEFFDIMPKHGFIKSNEVVPVVLSFILKKEIVTNFSNLFHENYSEIGKLIVYFGDESTRLRLNKLSSKYKEAPHIKLVEKSYSFLACNSFPSSDVDISFLNDTETSFTDLLHDGIEKTEIDIKVGRSVLSQVLKNVELESSEEFQSLSRSKLLIVKNAEITNNEFLEIENKFKLTKNI